MKFVAIILILISSGASAQTEQLLDSIYNNMLKAESVQYIQYTQRFYRNDNHHSADTLLLFLKRAAGAIPHFMVKELSGGTIRIYNGKQSFVINSHTRTLDIDDAKTTTSINKNSFWRQSWANLLQMLPAIRKTDQSQRSLVTEDSCYRIGFYFPGKRLAALNGFTELGTDSIEWRYEIVINKKDLLPSAFNVSIQKPFNKEDFIRVKWEQLQLNPPASPEASWFSSAYRDDYPHQSTPRNNMIRKGSMMPGWSLPVYEKSDSLRSSALRNKLTLLYFWEKNCGICMAAFPLVEELQSRFGSEQFRVIAINCYDTKDEVGFFFKKYSPAYTMCYGGLPLAEQLGFYGYPMALLTDEKGIVLDVAPFNKQALVSKIRDALNK
jgi:thiol-disulfide isomerase/thioredoxin